MFFAFLLSFAFGKAQHWQAIGNYINSSVTVIADSNYLYSLEGYFVNHRNVVSRWNGNAWDSVGANCYTSSSGTGVLGLFNGEVMTDACGGGLSKFNGGNWQIFAIPKNDIYTCCIAGLDVYNNVLYATGMFDTISHVICHNIAKWDGLTWQAIDTTTWRNPSTMNCAAIYNSELYIGGNFTSQDGTIRNLAKWNGTTWQNVGNISFGGMDAVQCMVIYKGELYIAGLLSGILGTGSGIARWNGSRWDDVQGGIGAGLSQVEALHTFNNELYVAGSFSFAGGIPASRIAKWDGYKWCSLGGYIDNRISSLTVYDSSLIISGGFWTIDGDSISYIAKWIGGSYTDSCTSPTGINEYELMQSEFYFYPNPSTSTITINYPLSTHPYSLIIKDAIGREVKEEKLPFNTMKKEIDVSELARGVYFLTVQAENRIITKKLIKE